MKSLVSNRCPYGVQNRIDWYRLLQIEDPIQTVEGQGIYRNFNDLRKEVISDYESAALTAALRVHK